jgi:molybdenum cofactor cytidylyltransferase
MSGGAPVIGILLAAGFSRRFGANKLLACMPDGRPVAAHAARALIQALPGSVAVVRPGVEALEQALRDEGLAVTVCPDAIEGMGASLAHAVRTLDGRPAAGFVVALADMPFIRPETIAEVAARLPAATRPLAPGLGGERGHPVGLPAGLRDELSRLTGDQGAREIIRRDGIDLFDCDDPGVLRDIDQPRDLPDGVPRGAGA